MTSWLASTLDSVKEKNALGHQCQTFQAVVDSYVAEGRNATGNQHASGEERKLEQRLPTLQLSGCTNTSGPSSFRTKAARSKLRM